MTTGVEFLTATGDLMLGLIKNPIVRAQGSVTTVGAGKPGWSVGSITYTNSSASSRPFICIKGDCEFFIASAFKSGSTWTFNILTEDPIGSSLSYFIFDEPTNTYGHVGLELYLDAPGLPIMFSMNTAMKPLRVAGSSAGSLTLPAGKTYAVAIGGRAGSKIWEAGAKNPSGIPDIDYYALINYAYVVNLTGNNLSFSLERYDGPVTSMFGTDTPDFSEERAYGPRNALVANVTGF